MESVGNIGSVESRGIVDNIKGVVIAPSAAMKYIAEHPYIEDSALIVGLLAILGAINGYITQSKIIYDYSGFPSGAPSETISIVMSVISPLVGVFVGWLLVAAVVHIVAMALGGEGEFKQTASIVGYSYVPVVVATAVVVIMMSMVEPLYVTISESNPFAVMDMMKDIYTNPIYIAVMLLGIVSRIWAVALQFMGMKEAHKISGGASAIAVGIPFVIYLLVTIMPVVGRVWRGNGIMRAHTCPITVFQSLQGLILIHRMTSR